MPVTLASRAEIVKKMDQQFNDDLKMRQDTTTVGKEMLKILAQQCHNNTVLWVIIYDFLLLRDDLIELCGSYKNRGPDSKFAHSEVFKVLSEEGATEARRICLELKKYAEQDERSCKLRSDFLKLVQILDSRADPKLGPKSLVRKILFRSIIQNENQLYRGVWYLSPFLKDFMSCREFLNHMETIFGEPVLPSLYVSFSYVQQKFWPTRPQFDHSLLKLSNAQLNIGAVGKDKKVDQWHFDSINFVAVLIFSNIDNMIGKDSI